MKHKLLLGICMVFLLTIPMASAWCWWDFVGNSCNEDEDNNTYTAFTRTKDLGIEIREDGVYSKKGITIDNAGYFIEDDKIKTRGELENLLEAEMVDQGIVYSCKIIEDKNTGAKCLSVDGNFNVELEVTKKEDGDYPVWVERANQSYVKGISNERDITFREDITELDFWLLNSKDTLKIKLDDFTDKIHIGDESTIVQIQSTTTYEYVNDTYVRTGSGGNGASLYFNFGKTTELRIRPFTSRSANSHATSFIRIQLDQILHPRANLTTNVNLSLYAADTNENCSVHFYQSNLTFLEGNVTNVDGDIGNASYFWNNNSIPPINWSGGDLAGRLDRLLGVDFNCTEPPTDNVIRNVSLNYTYMQDCIINGGVDCIIVLRGAGTGTNNLMKYDSREGTNPWSVSFEYEIINTAPTTPSLNLPTNETFVNDSSVTLNWTNSTDADGDPITYYLEVDDDPAFASVDYVNPSINEVNIGDLGITGDYIEIGDGFYFWRVLAYDFAENSSWSTIRSFNISHPYFPTMPDISPAVYAANFSFNGVCDNSTDYDGSTTTIKYEFYIDQGDPPTTLKQNLSTTTYSSDYNNGTYYFRCRANNGTYVSDYTPVTIYDVDNTAIWNYTVDYTTSGTEGGYYDFIINVTANNLSGDYIKDIWFMELLYGNLRYTMTEVSIPGANEYSFVKTNVMMPFESSTSFKFNFSSKHFNDTYIFNETMNYTQTISAVNIYDCEGSTNATSVMIYNFTLWDEFSNDQLQNTTPINLSDSSINIDMNYYKDNPNNYKNLSITASNSSNLTICMNPADATYNHTSIIDYGGPGYDRRQYYFNQDNFDNLTDHVRLYLLETAKTTSTTITAQDSSYNKLQNYIIKIQKYFIGTDNHITIGMLKTNIDGQDSIYLQHNEPFYKFLIYGVDNNLIFSSEDTKISSSSIVLTVEADSWGGDVGNFGSIIVVPSFNNGTRTFTLTYSNKHEDVDDVCMKVTKELTSGTSILGEQCSSATQDTLTQSIAGVGYFQMFVWQEKDGTSYLMKGISRDDRISFSSALGSEGILIAILIIITLSLAMIWSPSAAVVTSLIALIMMKIIGFVNIGWAAIIGICILGGFIVVKLKI